MTPTHQSLEHGAKNRPRSRSVPSPNGRLCLQERDLALLVTLDRFGYLLREQIQALYFESVPRCNARLRLLFDWQFVAKIETPLLLERGTASGCQAIYTCGKASYPLLAEHWSCEERVVRARHRAPTPSSLLHTLEEVNFYLHVQRAVQTVPSVALEGYFGEWESLHDYEVRVPGSAGNGWQRAVFKPDALLVLGQGRWRGGYAVEIDRGHTSAEAFAHKVRLHEQYRELGLFARRYDVTLEKTLVVTTSDTRRAHLQAVVRERGSGLFWITTFAAVKAHGVLGPIWFAPEAAKPQRFLPAKEGELL